MKKKLKIEVEIDLEKEENFTVLFTYSLDVIRSIIVSGVQAMTDKIGDDTSFSFTIEGKRNVKKKEINSEEKSNFEIFWMHFPSTACFTYREEKFKSERVLRSNYQVCEKLYTECLKTYKAESILQALKVHLETVKQESYKTHTNKMQYFSGIEPYLRQMKFQAFVGAEMPDNPLVKQETNFDIDL